MMRLGARVSRIVKNGICSRLPEAPPLLRPKMAAPSAFRYLSYNNSGFTSNPVAIEMIKYAMGVARAQRTEEELSRGLLILEQCESTQADDNSKGLVELARSTLLYESGSYKEAIERLGKIQDLNLSSIALKVAAFEAMVGVYLELHQEDAASVVADLALRLLGTVRVEMGDVGGFDVLNHRVKAIKGLFELICGNLNSAQFFEGINKERTFIGNATLSYGVFLHGKRDFDTAKELYQKVIHEMPSIKNFTSPNNLGACNMSPEEISISAACALGQLEAHTGNFNDAEEILTTALKQAEEHFGSRHPKVGVILTCIALMYRLKAVAEHSSSLLLQEGLFRKAIELLKAPPLDADGPSDVFTKRDIIALARGGYADALLVQQMRKDEGERLKKWSENAWGNSWMSLSEALELSNTSPKVPVIDTRICRAI